jgi:hypothetical protein
VILRLTLSQRWSGSMFAVCSADGASTAGACCSRLHGMGSSDFARGREGVGSTRPSTGTCSTIPADCYVQHETCSRNSKPSRLLVHGRNRVAPEGRSSQPRMGCGQFALASADDLRRRFDARLARSARHVISRRPCRPGQCLWWGTTMFVTRTRRVPLLGFLAFGRDELLRQRRLLSMNVCRRCSPGRSAQSPGCWAWPRSRPSPSHTPTRNPRRPTRPTRHRHGPGTSGSAGVSRASAVTSMAMVSTGESPRAAIPVAQVRPALPGRRKRPGCEEPHEEQAHLLPAPRRWIDRNQI